MAANLNWQNCEVIVCFYFYKHKSTGSCTILSLTVTFKRLYYPIVENYLNRLLPAFRDLRNALSKLNKQYACMYYILRYISHLQLVLTTEGLKYKEFTFPKHLKWSQHCQEKNLAKVSLLILIRDLE